MESKGLSNEKFMPPFTSNKSLSPKLVWMNNSRKRLEFKGSYLNQAKAPFTPNNVMNLYIAYELNIWLQDLNAEFTLKDCLFGNIKITKNTDPDKFSYPGYGIGFDSHLVYSIPNFDWGKNSIIFGVDMSSSVHTDNKNKDILILSKGTIRGLYNTTLTAEAQRSINFSRSGRKFCLSLNYNVSTSFLLANATKIYQFKAKISEINGYPLC